MNKRAVRKLRRAFLSQGSLGTWEPTYEGPQHFTGGRDGLKRPWRAFKRGAVVESRERTVPTTILRDLPKRGFLRKVKAGRVKWDGRN